MEKGTGVVFLPVSHLSTNTHRPKKGLPSPFPPPLRLSRLSHQEIAHLPTYYLLASEVQIFSAFLRLLANLHRGYAALAKDFELWARPGSLGIPPGAAAHASGSTRAVRFACWRIPARRAAEKGTGVVLWNGAHGLVIFFGRPGGRIVDSSPSRRTIRSHHGPLPNGWPRVTDRRSDSNSPLVSARFTRFNQSTGRGIGQSLTIPHDLSSPL
jgi:hypothetical protein